MKLGFISDLHIDVNPKETMDDYFIAISKAIFDKELDYFFIGGDIANHYSITLDFVEKLQTQVNIPVYFVPGNHDYWQRDEMLLSGDEIHQKFVEHPQSLMKKPVKINNRYTVVGHGVWYNHAYYADRFSSEELEIGKYRHGRWQDKKFIQWHKTDKEVSKQFAAELEKDLESVQTDAIILVTHMITYPAYIVPMPHKVFDFFNAFIATDDILPFYDQYPISHSIMGHVHFRAQRDYKNTKMIVNSLGYRRQWRTKNISDELKQSIYIINI